MVKRVMVHKDRAEGKFWITAEEAAFMKDFLDFAIPGIVFLQQMNRGQRDPVLHNDRKFTLDRMTVEARLIHRFQIAATATKRAQRKVDLSDVDIKNLDFCLKHYEAGENYFKALGGAGSDGGDRGPNPAEWLEFETMFLKRLHTAIH